MVVASKPLFNKYVGTGPQSARLSFQSSELPLLAPSPASGCCFPLWSQGGDTLACGRGVGGANSAEGMDTLVL
jgi:hypothetical protein